MMLFSAVRGSSRRHEQAFTLAEVMIGVMIMGIMFVSLYVGLSSGFSLTKAAREDLRATQIMIERLEGIRLYNWDQLCYSNMIPAKFTNYYYPLGLAITSNKGVEYHGTMVITNAGLVPASTYADSMRLITVSVSWNSGSLARTRSMSTYATKFGVQNYVYSN